VALQVEQSCGMPTLTQTLLVGLAVLGVAPVVQAQTQSESQAVQAVVNRMFDGMRTRDTAMMRSSMVPSTVLERATPDGLGAPIQMNAFIDRVAAGSGPGGNEQIDKPKIEIDGNLASLWTYYTFTPGGKTQIDHCGVDAFLLRKGADGWKIFHISDTSRNEGCMPVKK
jgi:putative lumazine-binding protein